MPQRAYISNISATWPMVKQLAVIGAVTADYADELDAKQRRSRKPEHLKNRALMLRPTSRGSAHIAVAALPCLAFDTDDFLDVLTKASEIGAVIRVYDPPITFAPDKRHSTLQRAAKAFAKARADAAAHDRGKIGGQIAGERRKAITKAKAMLLKPDWYKPEFATADLLAREGLSYNSAKLYLGSRSLALKATKAALKRAERRKAKA